MCLQKLLSRSHIHTHTRAHTLAHVARGLTKYLRVTRNAMLGVQHETIHTHSMNVPPKYYDAGDQDALTHQQQRYIYIYKI